MKFKIGFIAHGPASANSLYPIIERLKHDNQIEVHLFSYHPYVCQLWECTSMEYKKVYPIILKGMDLLIYGTGSSNPIETSVSTFGKEFGITTVSILDLYWASDDNIKSRFPVAPDYLVVPNDDAFNQAKRIIPDSECNIMNLGNPHFDRLLPRVGNWDCKKPMTVGFFSQCSTVNDFSTTMDESKQALEALIEIQTKHPDVISKIIMAPHPREDTRWLQSKVSNEVSLSEVSSDELILQVDLAVGASCTLQYEAQMIGKPVVFYNGDKAPFIRDVLDSTNKTFTPSISTFNATGNCLNLIYSIMSDTPYKVQDNYEYETQSN